MISSDVLTTLFQHHVWANLQIVEACRALTAEQLAYSKVWAYGSIFVTLQHITRAEQGYFSRISTGKRRVRPENEPDMTLGEIADSLRATGAGLIEWAHKIKAEDTVQIEWDNGELRPMPTALLFVQVIEHAHEHREQIKAMLTELGIEPPDLQGWAYFERVY